MKLEAKLGLLFSSLILAVSIFISSCSGVGDDNAPAGVTDFSFDLVSRQFRWTATGDDGNSGRATVNDIRFLRDTEVAGLLGLASVDDLDNVPDSRIQEIVQNNFSNATQILNELSPDSAGTPQSFLAPRLDVTGVSRFFLALNVRDEVGNNSGPSNVVEVRTPLVSPEFRDSANAGCFGDAASSGDFNGDDIDDLVIGDPCLGMVYIFFGRNDLTIGSSDGDGIFDIGSGDTPDVTIVGSGGEMFGASLAGVGNIDGDRSDDLAIGAPDFDGKRGRVLVILGGRSIPSFVDLTNGANPAFTITGESVGDSFGLTVIRRGTSSIFVGAPGALSNRGKAYLFRGGDLESATPADDARTTIIGQSSGDMFGFSMTETGRIDNNNSIDLAIGSPGGNKVHVFLDLDSGVKELPTDTSDVVTIQGGSATGFGSSIAGAGNTATQGNIVGIVMDEDDVDDRDDLLVGAPGSGMDTGSVFLYSGDDIADAETSGVSPGFVAELTGLNPDDRFGASVAALGDLNPLIGSEVESEGIIIDYTPTNTDFAVGAPGTAGGAGTVYLFFGRNEFPATLSANDSDIVLDGNAPVEEFGSILVNLGNITEEDNSVTARGFADEFAVGGSGFLRVEF